MLNVNVSTSTFINYVLIVENFEPKKTCDRAQAPLAMVELLFFFKFPPTETRQIEQHYFNFNYSLSTILVDENQILVKVFTRFEVEWEGIRKC